MTQPDMRSDESGRTSHGELDLTAAGARMLQAISAASIASGSHEELETAVREFVAELHEANEPPEQVLLAIKRILAQAGLRPSHQSADPAMGVDRLAAVYRDVIASTIRHYFAASDGSGSTA
jgi:hypothetical protein